MNEYSYVATNKKTDKQTDRQTENFTIYYVYMWLTQAHPNYLNLRNWSTTNTHF